jgi:uncharacterized phage-associated protein
MHLRVRDWPRFNERKALQATAYVLRLAGGRLNYMKLLKLLYLADRTALIERGLPVTTDRPVSMRYGPVLSNTYSLIRDQAMPNVASEFARFVVQAEPYEVKLEGDPGEDELSRYEKALLERMWREHGSKTQWELVDYTHGLPEWTDPADSSLEIRAEEILRSAGLPEEEIANRLELLRELRQVEALLERR